MTKCIIIFLSQQTLQKIKISKDCFMSWKDEDGKRQVSERNHLAYKTAPYQSTCILAVQTDKTASLATTVQNLNQNLLQNMSTLHANVSNRNCIRKPLEHHTSNVRNSQNFSHFPPKTYFYS